MVTEHLLFVYLFMNIIASVAYSTEPHLFYCLSRTSRTDIHIVRVRHVSYYVPTSPLKRAARAAVVGHRGGLSQPAGRQPQERLRQLLAAPAPAAPFLLLLLPLVLLAAAAPLVLLLAAALLRAGEEALLALGVEHLVHLPRPRRERQLLGRAVQLPEHVVRASQLHPVILVGVDLEADDLEVAAPGGKAQAHALANEAASQSHMQIQGLLKQKFLSCFEIARK